MIEANAIKEKKIPKVTLNFALTNSDVVFISNASVKAKVPINHRESLLEKFLKLINKSHWYKNRTISKYKPTDLPANAPKNFDVIKKQLPLNQMINKYDIYPLTGTIKKAAIDRKKSMDEKDGERIEIEVQKNNLESLIYKSKEMLTEQEENENKEKIVLSEIEIKNYKEQISHLFENLFEKGHLTEINLEEIKNNISNVQKIIDLIKDRSEGIIKREKGIIQFKNFIKETRAFYEAMNNIAVNKGKKTEKEDKKEIVNDTEEETEIFKDIEKGDKEEYNDDDDEVTEAGTETEELKFLNMEKIVSEKVKELCSKAENWLNEVMEKQSLLNNWDIPAFNDKDIENKILEIYGNVSKILEDFKNKNSSDKKTENEKIHSNIENNTTSNNEGKKENTKETENNSDNNEEIKTEIKVENNSKKESNDDNIIINDKTVKNEDELNKYQNINNDNDKKDKNRDEL